MNRKIAIQYLIDKLNAKHYLEIGVFNGSNFLELSAPKKTAVDPVDCITFRYKLHAIRHDFRNIFNKYFTMTSDDFFQNHSEYLKENSIDISFIDGLHTYEQTIRDLKNVLLNLNKGGVVVLHDCCPNDEFLGTVAESFEDAIKDVDDKKRAWSGDCWKAIYHAIKINEKHNMFEIFVLDCDYGLGIVVPNDNFNKTICSEFVMDQDILNLDFSFMSENKRSVLNLKDENYLYGHFENRPGNN